VEHDFSPGFVGTIILEFTWKRRDVCYN